MALTNIIDAYGATSPANFCSGDRNLFLRNLSSCIDCNPAYMNNSKQLLYLTTNCLI